MSEETHRFENGNVSDTTESEESVTDENKLRKVGRRYIIGGGKVTFGLSLAAFKVTEDMEIRTFLVAINTNASSGERDLGISYNKNSR